MSEPVAGVRGLSKRFGKKEALVDVTVDVGPGDVIGVLGSLFPGDAAEQWVGNDKDWLYSMLYVSYSY